MRLAAALLLVAVAAPARAHARYEVWAIDQSSSPGLTYGGTLYAATRAPIDCVRTSAGSGGARQVHFAIPSPDETYIAVANQNGKLFERIDTDYAANAFHLNPAATIDLAGCTTPNGLPCQAAGLRPDNSPICPIVDASSGYVFVTLRGGGLFVVDARTTPMQIVAEYDVDTVHPNGCLGVQVRDKMYVDSGGGTPSHLFGADIYAFPVSGFSPLLPPNTPAPRLVLSDTAAEADAHGATLTGSVPYGRLLGVAPASNVDAAGVERADVHALTLRVLPGGEDDGR